MDRRLRRAGQPCVAASTPHHGDPARAPARIGAEQHHRRQPHVRAGRPELLRPRRRKPDTGRRYGRPPVQDAARAEELDVRRILRHRPQPRHRHVRGDGGSPERGDGLRPRRAAAHRAQPRCDCGVGRRARGEQGWTGRTASPPPRDRTGRCRAGGTIHHARLAEGLHPHGAATTRCRHRRTGTAGGRVVHAS